uniref:TssN family type VI secretion system protein n=1 Tax=Roseihalotalea indica TaxID=2867963 RepID=A0AA49GJC3_9BACT|nr:TssN family type VI secretion system protein [Tunicatimonas sp. TK19036]
MITIISLSILAIASGALFMVSSKARPDFVVGASLGYAALFILILACTAALGLVDNLAPNITFWILLCVFLIAGIVHTWLLHRKFSWAQSDLFLAELLFTLFIFSAGTILLCLIYQLLTDVPSVAFLVGAALPFLIPFFLQKSLQLWQSVPPAYYYKWFFPTEKEAPVLTFQHTIPLQFNFCKEVDKDDSTTFSVVAPTNILFGELFHSFLEEYNTQFPDSPIQAYRPPYSWMFYSDTGKWWNRKKVIDPDVSILENSIKPNESVNAVRIHR